MTAAVHATEDLEPGTLVSDYRIERVIGVGGMGVVYGARHPVIGKRAAIKVLSARYCADVEGVQRFVQEAQAVNQIGHANIVDIFAFGVLDDGRSYLIMEWLQGETLMEKLGTGKLSPDEAISILIPLTRALDAAHAAGVIHRDLKPENVILVPEDDGFRVKLLDFGIAKLSTPSVTSSKTATGTAMGTPLFMSPEQARGHNVDSASDVYSLGVLAYLLVCGQTPFEDEPTPVEVLHAHIRKPPPSPRTLTPELSDGLEHLIMQLLAKKPEDRPPLSDVRRRLAALAGGGYALDSGPVVRMPTSVIDDPLDVPPRSRMRWVVGAGLAAVALTATIALAMRGGSADKAAAPTTPTATTPPPAAAATPAPAPAPAPVAPTPAPAATTPAVTPTPTETDATATAGDPADPKPARTKPRTKPTTRVKSTTPDPDAVVNPFAKKKPQ